MTPDFGTAPPEPPVFSLDQQISVLDDLQRALHFVTTRPIPTAVLVVLQTSDNNSRSDPNQFGELDDVVI